MNELIKIFIAAIPVGLILFIAGLAFGAEFYPKIKLIIADISAFFGWLGKGVRKKSVESEYQGTINGIIKNYNKNFQTPVLPNFKIEWVTAENQQNILKDNVAIVCLSFDKKDHNLNFYNATLNFVKTGLISKVKDYLTKTSSQGIDLLTTHIILKNNRRDVLSVFRRKLNEFDDATKLEFETLVPTNDKGLFLNLLLPEFHFYGELIDTYPPSSEFSIEADGFLNWFKELASREFDERTNLKYTSKNLKVGVILVAKNDTWESYGASAYTKWADYYSSEAYNSVYVLAKGSEGFERATQVTKILTQSKGFDQINKDPRIKCISSDGYEYIVTCYSLRPNRATIAYLAWESFKEYFENDKPVPAIIDNVHKDSIIVSVFGLKFELASNLLSELTIADARKIFKKEDELYLKITSFNVDEQIVELSNVSTASDPKHFIESILKVDKIYPAKVERIQTDKQGVQIGLKVSTDDLKSWIFIPRSKATSSRFIDLNSKYQIGQAIDVVIENYNSVTSNFVGYVENIPDPWEESTFKALKNGEQINVVVKQINEFSVICEIEEGLECRFSQQEISWHQSENSTSKFKIDDKVDVKVISIDEDRKLILVSPKQLFKTPELEYFEKHHEDIVTAEIIKIIADKGLLINYTGGVNTGFIPWFEIGWGPVGHLDKIFKVGDKIDITVADFDSAKNRIRFSLKRTFRHDFQDWSQSVQIDDWVDGKVIGYYENSIHIEVTTNAFCVQAFVLRKFISNLTYVDQEDMPFFLPVGETFTFSIDEINDDKQTISLTRKEFLAESRVPEYGASYSFKYVKKDFKKVHLYSNTLEGWSSLPVKHPPLGTEVEAILVSSSNNEFEIINS